MKYDNYESDPSDQVPNTHFQDITIFKRGRRGGGNGWDGLKISNLMTLLRVGKAKLLWLCSRFVLSIWAS